MSRKGNHEYIRRQIWTAWFLLHCMKVIMKFFYIFLGWITVHGPVILACITIINFRLCKVNIVLAVFFLFKQININITFIILHKHVLLLFNNISIFVTNFCFGSFHWCLHSGGELVILVKIILHARVHILINLGQTLSDLFLIGHLFGFTKLCHGSFGLILELLSRRITWSTMRMTCFIVIK